MKNCRYFRTPPGRIRIHIVKVCFFKFVWFYSKFQALITICYSFISESLNRIKQLFIKYNFLRLLEWWPLHVSFLFTKSTVLVTQTKKESCFMVVNLRILFNPPVSILWGTPKNMKTPCKATLGESCRGCRAFSFFILRGRSFTPRGRKGRRGHLRCRTSWHISRW